MAQNPQLPTSRINQQNREETRHAVGSQAGQDTGDKLRTATEKESQREDPKTFSLPGQAFGFGSELGPAV